MAPPGRVGGAQRRFAQRRPAYDYRAPDAEGDGGVAGRKYLFVVRPDRAVLQPASAGSEGDRRWRRRAGHQRPRSDSDRSAYARTNLRGGSRSGAAAAHRRSESAPAGGGAEEGTALHAGIAPPGPAQRPPLAGAQSPRA